MKKYLPVVAAVAVLVIFSLSALVFGPRKFAASLPPPFNFITNGGYVSADAGFFGDLTVSGTCTGCGGGGGISNPYLGTFITDAGEVNTLNAETAVTSNGLAADAGNFNTLSIAKSAALNGGAIATGLLIGDAGNFGNDLIVYTGTLADAGGIEIGGTAGGCFSNWSSASGFMALYPTACVSTNNTNWLLASNSDTSNVQLHMSSSGTISIVAGASTIATWTGSSGVFKPNGLTINSGTPLSNVGVGSCVLSAGTCNAVVAGNKGSSLCFAGIQGLYAIDAGGAACHVQADAGSATVVCDYNGLLAYPAAATVGIHCDN